MSFKIGDTIRVTKGESPYFSVGDIGKVTEEYSYDKKFWRVDFNRPGQTVYDDGLWYVGELGSSEGRSTGEGVVLSELELAQLNVREAEAALAEVQKNLERFSIRLDSSQGYLRTADCVNLVGVRVYGGYAYKGYYLNPDFSWEVVMDEEHIPVLVPTRK